MNIQPATFQDRVRSWARMPSSTLKPRDGSVASLLRRANGSKVPLRDGDLTPQALLATRPVQEKLLTLTSQQRLLQQIHDTQAVHHLQSHAYDGDDGDDAQDECGGGLVGGGKESDKIDHLFRELYELQEARGPDDTCISTTEQAYLRLLYDSTVFALSHQVIATDHHVVDNRSSHTTICEALLTLSVKPTPLAREIAFTLLHEITHVVSVWSAMATSHASAHNPAHPQPLSRLFTLCVDMLTKSLAIASTSTPLPTTTDVSTQSPDYKWLLRATSCLTAFLRQTSGHSYRQDRLVKLDAATLTFLFRAAFSLTTASGHEPELQDQILEIVVCALYAQHEARGTSASRKSLATPPDHSELPISLADVDKIGGLELLVAIFYSTRSESSRRLVLVVVFDLALEQLKSSKKREGDDAWAPSYDSLLRCLQHADFAALAAQSPISFTGPSENSIAKTLHAAVENELLEKHVTVVWSAFRAVLQLDELFVHSASLANAIKVLSNATSQQPHTHDSVAESIANKTQQLIASGRMEDRFKGERWLAELLVYALPTETSDAKDHGDERLLGKQGTLAGEDPMEESICFDEGAEFRLCARAKLWELARASSVAMRLAFTHVLSLFTRRRLRSGAAKTTKTSHLQEMKQFLKALVTANEQSVAVLVSVLETLLLLVVSPQEIPYLDCQRLKYDAESSDFPQAVVGAVVGSDSLASKILRGIVSIDATLVTEIPLEFLLHTLAVCDASLHSVSTPSYQGGSCGSVVSQSGDYAVVAALLVSYTVESHTTSHGSHHTNSVIPSLASYLDACDTRIAVIMARTITSQLKREYGERQYLAVVRELHAAAVDRDDESALANEVAHARAVLHHVTDFHSTP